ncbi:hypothetical protein D041_0721A, partial [Vibrio parahaemolyticus EKP-008]|jgi:hypothetical protein
MINDR